MWIIIEWLGAILGVGGALMMASKKFSPSWSWLCWIISNLLFVFLFVFTQQYSLLGMQIAGTFINTLGLWQWYKNKNSSKVVMHMFYAISMVLLLIALINIINFIITPSIKLIELIGSLLAVSAALLIASCHKYSRFCWLIWMVGNLSIFGMTLFTHQWGFMTLQIGFIIANGYGTWNWIIKHKSVEIK